MADWEYLDRNTDLAETVRNMMSTNLICDDLDLSTARVTRSSKSDKVLVQETQEILLPFYQEVEIEVPVYRNYRDYDLFSLKTRVIPEIHLYRPDWYPHFILLPVEGSRSQVALRIYKGGEFVPLQGQDYQEIKDITDQALESYKDYCLLIHDYRPIVYRSTCMSQPWLAGMILSIPIPELITYPDCEDLAVLNDRWIYDQGAIYIRLNPDYNYALAYNNLYLSTVEILYSLWNRGSILLDPSIDQSFIDNWELVPSTQPLINQDERQVYHPQWKNLWIAPSPSQFLMERRSGVNTLRYTVGESQVNRHLVASMLETCPTFSGKYLVVEVKTYQEAQEIQALVVKALSNVNGVVITTIDSLNEVLDKQSICKESHQVTYQLLDYGCVKSYLFP